MLMDDMKLALLTKVLIHWGNDAKDTEGCILVGQDQSSDEVENSRAAFSDLWSKIEGSAADEDRRMTRVGGATIAGPKT